MSEPEAGFDADSVREAWDVAAEAYAAGQAAGRDHYRYEFLGPAQVAACGDVRGLRVLDVGCGSGYLARELAQRGARATGVDLSPRMIEHARSVERRAPLGIDYHAVDAQRVADEFEAGTFDLAAACVSLQDMPDPAAALRAVAAVLRPGGRFVASIPHPCTNTPFRQWERDPFRGKRWLCLDRYFDRGILRNDWQGWQYPFTTPELHVPLQDWFAWIGGAGFAVRAFLEPRPTAEAIRARPRLEDATRMPYFVIFDLVRTP
jgi:SAM-dependent methyltransferase